MVSLNWRLMQMPAAVFDVLVHDTCALPNHSPRFWREVARVLPDFEARRAMLHRLDPATGLLTASSPSNVGPV
ncbi:MAG: M48 family metallopeptidase [Chromatiales bacterium]|nr:M48 family metallopeptidase [Chromatiales bacterium]